MAPILTATGSVKYLGVVLDPRQSYWDHVQSLAEKSKSLYSRLRTLTSANWGISHLISRVLYRAVFLPKITYAAEVWSAGAKWKKAEKKLCSIQRPPLLAITVAYKTASTNCLSVVAGVLPLDLEISRPREEPRKRGDNPRRISKPNRRDL
jgi:hypothetical protein